MNMERERKKAVTEQVIERVMISGVKIVIEMNGGSKPNQTKRKPIHFPHCGFSTNFEWIR